MCSGQSYMNYSMIGRIIERCIFRVLGLCYEKNHRAFTFFKRFFDLVVRSRLSCALSPIEGASNVPVESAISWEPVVGVTGYIISIGTTPGDTDVVNEQQVGNDTSFTPSEGLPENTTVYVTLTLFFFNQDNVVCPSQAFTT